MISWLNKFSFIQYEDFISIFDGWQSMSYDNSRDVALL